MQSSLSVWTDYGVEVLIQGIKQKQHDALRIEWPSHEEMKESAELRSDNTVNRWYLKNVFGVVDGRGSMPCADYMGVEVPNLLVYNFKGELIHSTVNFPGRWYDLLGANISILVYPLLFQDNNTPLGTALLSYSAFFCSQNQR